ncbi:MAG: ATP-dependent Clp protease ATP-binding subunit [Oscillospiraceae bacterium]|nr:ATP-dependent Clp protease ATP-binding subunit [Oscillospiraceae bacterium]
MFQFEGFTEKANNAINYAVNTAEEYGHTYLGTEHILIGLLKEESGVAASALKEAGVKLEEVEDRIKSTVGTGARTQLTLNDFTARTKRIIQMSVKAAGSMGHDYIGTEHILLSLLNESDCFASRFLHDLGISPEAVTKYALDAVGGESPFEDEADEAPDTGSFFGSAKAAHTGRGGKSSSKTLEKFGRNLTEEAKKGNIDPVIGRSEEIDRVIQILSRRTKNNPCLIGEPGVGKTAIAEGLAIKINSGDVPETLKDKKLITLDLTGMVAGTKYRGDFEERIKSAIDEVQRAKDIILFIDEIHTIIGTGAAEGAADAANILKPSLSKGSLQVIGATTIDEYRKHIEKDAALERRFQPVTVGEPSEDESVQILKGLRDRYEAHHKVKITDEAIAAAVHLSTRYINDRYLPDKAIDLIDEAASRVRLRKLTPPPDLQELQKRISALQAEKSEAVNNQDFERAARIRDEEKLINEKLQKAKADWDDANARASGEVNEGDIAEIVSMWSGVPVVQLTQAESERLLKLEEILHRRIVGQEEAVTSVAKAIRRGRVGLKDKKRPTGSFIFLGPTGVGKTELCKALAEALFGNEESIIRLDMSEFMEKHTVSKLIGSPPGYIGFDEGGQLTEKIRRKPYSVLLFDEIEKAHPDVFNIMLQILEDGQLTDSQGRRVSFRNTIIIMTSNVGARLITEKQKALGFGTQGSNPSEEDYEAVREAVLGELKKTFKPEFLNRIDDIIVFRKLGDEDIKAIAQRMLEDLNRRVNELDMQLEFDPSVVEKIASEGFDPIYGARPLRRAIQSKLLDPLSEKLLESSFKAGDSIKCRFDENLGFVFE